MEALAELFETNRIIVLTVYGQVFIVLGLAIALQSWKRSTLALARPLPWLAAFGIVHGFHEWGYLFIPIQSGYLPLSLTETLLVLQLLMKGVSFALLLQLGVELVAAMTNLPILPRLRLLPAAALLAWGGATLALPHWVPLRAEHLWLVAGVGLAGAVGQYTIIEAFRLGEASLLAPLEYGALVCGVLLDFVLWHTLPDRITWVGAAIIVASGLYLLRRERVHVEAEHP